LKKYLVLDYILLGAIVSIVTLQPYFMHGAINLFEVGLYLPQISELFHGKVLCRDIFILRGPLEIFMPAFLMRFFGMHIGLLNAYFYFGTVVTLFIYALFALGLYRTRGFVYLFTLVLIARTFPWSCFNVWGGIRFGLGISGVLLAVNFLRGKRPAQLLLSGILTGLAFWTSSEVGVFGFISVMIALLLHGYAVTKDTKASFRHILIYIAGNIVASLPFVFYLALNNAFFLYADGVRVVLTKMAKVFDPALSFETPMNLKEFLMAFSPLNHSFKYTLPFLFYVMVGVYLFRRFVKRRFDVFDIAILTVAVYGALLYKGAFRSIEGPPYRMALQPLLLVMFFYLERFYMRCRDLKQGMRGLKKALVVFLLFALPIYALAFSVSKYTKRFFIFKEFKSVMLYNKRIAIPYADPDPTPLKSVRARGIIAPGAQAGEIDSVVEYIVSHTQGREPVFGFTDLGVYNFLTDRPSVGRFYCAELSFMDEGWFEEMLAELKGARPRFIICAKEYARLKPYASTVGKYLKAVDQFLQANYEIKKSFSTVNVFERKM